VRFPIGCEQPPGVRSLRTQQRAWATSSRGLRSHRRTGCTESVSRGDGLLVSVPPLSTAPRAYVSSAGLDRAAVLANEQAGQVLLRKEVIQPHLPVRLPCYDFVPIADPTFDSSLSCELGHWLRVLPTFVT
jgi:hypothetical protein